MTRPCHFPPASQGGNGQGTKGLTLIIVCFYLIMHYDFCKPPTSVVSPGVQHFSIRRIFLTDTLTLSLESSTLTSSTCFALL